MEHRFDVEIVASLKRILAIVDGERMAFLSSICYYSICFLFSYGERICICEDSKYQS